MKTLITNAALALAFAFPLVAAGHIVPPEQYHPAAEGYRTLSFLVNLNPVPWELVESESAKIAAAYEAVEPGTGEKYAQSVRDLILAVETEASISSPTAEMRIQTARGVFSLSTRTIAQLINLHLVSAEENLGDYDTAWQAFEAARQIWESFAYEVRHTDPQGFRTTGGAWIEAASALGSGGILGVGGQPADSEVFGSAVRTLRAYVEANFGPDFAAPESGRLAALPAASTTFDPAAVVPAKLPPGHNLNKQLPRPRQILNFVVRGGDESETAVIALGDMLFDSPYIFGEPARSLQISCNTCHNKGVTNPNFFIPGLSTSHGGLDVSSNFFRPASNNAVADTVDIPDLRGIKFTGPYGRNGRVGSLREFTRNVIVGEFNGAEPAPVVLDAIVAYMNEFDLLPNPNLEPTGKLSAAAPDSAKRGEVLFNTSFAQMNNLSCADCHRPSSQFTDGLSHDIGSVTKSSAYSADGAMNTPTLLSAAYTAPYFHDGSQPTLRSVTDWFNKAFSLGLTEAQASDLTAYVETVGSGEESYEETLYTLESEMEEFKFFLSSYEFIKETNDRDLINTLFQTIELEISAHKWDVQDQRQLPVLTELQEMMGQAYAANVAGDPDQVDAVVSKYRDTYEQYADVLK